MYDIPETLKTAPIVKLNALGIGNYKKDDLLPKLCS